MAKKQQSQPKDTGKLTNFHYGSEKDHRTPANDHQNPSKNL